MAALTRGALLLALVCAIGCADESAPTTPSVIPQGPGVPQSLTVETDTTSVPHNGGPVTILAVVTVRPGEQLARVPLTIRIHLAGGDPALDVVNPWYTDANGHVRQAYYFTRPSEVTVTAGDFSRSFSVTCEPASPPPQSPPPTCHGSPGSCPPPPPDVPPPPSPRIDLSVVAVPASGTTASTFTFTATATPLNGAGAVTAFEWDFESDGTFDETTAIGTASKQFPTSGVKAVKVRASNASGQTAEATVQVSVDPTEAPPVNEFKVTVRVDPAISGNPLRVNTQLVLKATITESSGTPVPAGTNTYEWLVKDGFNVIAYEAAAGEDFHELTVRIAHAGPTSAGVNVALHDGRRAYGRVEFTVVP
jgi:hypothetical protein